MLVCHSLRFVFVHIHRTGGTSLRQLFADLALPDTLELPQHCHLNCDQLDPSEIAGYRKLAFVRNPWERLWSWYSLFAKYFPDGAEAAPSFERFLLNYSDMERRYLLDRPYFRFNQLEYLCGTDGALDMDFVGRFENYADDAQRMLALVGIDPAPTPHLNAGSRLLYQAQYSPETRDLVASLCAEDIQHFGFRF